MIKIYTTEQRSRKKDGRKTTNAALITLSRAGAIASMVMLVLGGMDAGATWIVDDDDDDDDGGAGIATAKTLTVAYSPIVVGAEITDQFIGGTGVFEPSDDVTAAVTTLRGVIGPEELDEVLSER